MKSYSKQKKKHDRNIVLVIVGGFVAILASVILWHLPWVWYDTSPKPLGDQFEYIGKTNDGCAYLLPCIGERAYSTYYYATSMNIGEVEQYFTVTSKVKDPIQESDLTDVWFRNSKGNQDFILRYYRDGYIDPSKLGLRETQKLHIVSIRSEDYDAARDSLWLVLFNTRKNNKNHLAAFFPLIAYNKT